MRSYSVTMPSAQRRLEVLVEVLDSDGFWHEGFFKHWRRDGDRWSGFVRYSVGVGMTHIGWCDQELIHRPEELHSRGHGSGSNSPAR